MLLSMFSTESYVEKKGNTDCECPFSILNISLLYLTFYYLLILQNRPGQAMAREQQSGHLLWLIHWYPVLDVGSL